MSLTGTAENWIQDPIAITKILHRAMAELEIPYFISGHVAALIHGEPRTTMNLDMVVQIDRQDIREVRNGSPPVD